MARFSGGATTCVFAGKFVNPLESRARRSGIRTLVVGGFTVVGIRRTSEGHLDCSDNGAPVGVLPKFRGEMRREANVGTVASGGIDVAGTIVAVAGTDVAGTIAVVVAVAICRGAVVAAGAVTKRLGAMR